MLLTLDLQVQLALGQGVLQEVCLLDIVVQLQFKVLDLRSEITLLSDVVIVHHLYRLAQ